MAAAGNTVRTLNEKSLEVQRLKYNHAREICSIKTAMGADLWSTSMVPLLNGTHAACLGRRDVKDEGRVSDRTCRTPTNLARSGGPNDLLRIFKVAEVRFCLRSFRFDVVFSNNIVIRFVFFVYTGSSQISQH